MIRATYGVTAMTSVAVGRIIPSMLSHGRVPGGMIVIAGRKPVKTVVAKRTTRLIPTTNSGSGGEDERRERARDVERPVAAERGVGADRDRERDRDERRAEHQERRVHDLVAQEVRHRLLRGQRVPGVAVQEAGDPVQVLREHRARRGRAGHAAPSGWPGVAVRPRIDRAGSPGSACVAANTTTETSNSTSRPSRSRRMNEPGDASDPHDERPMRTRWCGSHGRTCRGSASPCSP